jgi:hypothetical protein
MRLQARHWQRQQARASMARPGTRKVRATKATAHASTFMVSNRGKRGAQYPMTVLPIEPEAMRVLVEDHGLLGLGWNFGFIGATALVTDVHAPCERAKVQALNDFLVFGTVAAASFGAGRLLDSAGWETINALMLPMIAVVLAMLAGLAWRDRRQAA